MAGPGELDPRTVPPAPGDDIRPVVALPRSGPPTWVYLAFAAVAALILFLVLDSRRRAAPAEDAAPREGARIAAPPPLYVPVQPAPPAIVPQQVVPVAPAPAPRAAPSRPVQPQVVYVPQPSLPQPVASPPPPPRVDAGAALVIDTTAGAPAAAAEGAAAAGAAAADAGLGATLGARARAGMFANPTMTVPQGTLIPAVLETAFNSTRPGFARAIVSRDVRGFDGTRVLIPRGSRLIGEYRSDAQAGQKRALVNWVRLVRPDGVTIGIGSPATDTLGRGGVKAKVNTHFFERFANAILQSTVDIGFALAARAGNSPVVVALPGQGSAGGNMGQTQQVRPTLTVPAATSISVFVARDLDFTGAGGRQ
jgi:type IV secretion system protein VirB10